MTHRSGSDSATFFRVDMEERQNILQVQQLYTHFINVCMYIGSLSQGLW